MEDLVPITLGAFLRFCETKSIKICSLFVLLQHAAAATRVMNFVLHSSISPECNYDNFSFAILLNFANFAQQALQRQKAKKGLIFIFRVVATQKAKTNKNKKQIRKENRRLFFPTPHLSFVLIDLGIRSSDFPPPPLSGRELV